MLDHYPVPAPELDRRYLTEDLGAVQGQLKTYPEDFVVDEIRQVPPSGEGPFLLVRFEKKGLSTFQAIRMIARGLGLRERQLGYAGLKDARAITTQNVSIPDRSPEDVRSLRLSGVKILSIARHHEPLRVGHLVGNRFRIRIRYIEPAQRRRFFEMLEVLRAEGVPNYFGRQRFGFKANSHRLGRFILRHDYLAFLGLFLGEAHPREDPDCQEARRLFEAGEHEEAIRKFLPAFPNEAKALRMFHKTGGDAYLAYNAIPRKARQFFVSAYQSYLFNSYLNQRMDRFGELLPGDIVKRHETGDLFTICDPTPFAEALSRFEISPTGPIFGAYMQKAGKPQSDVEAQLLSRENTELEEFLRIDGFVERGSRRALRFPIEDLEVHHRNDEATVSFRLPKGCYATSVFDEMFKT